MTKTSQAKTLTFHEPAYPGLRKIISGGQCGSDFGALSAAHILRVETGGTAPRTFRTWFRPMPELGTVYGLTEDESYKYQPRTKKNVADSDGTLIIASNPYSPGCTLTSRFAHELDKPSLVINCADYHSELDTIEAHVKMFSERIISWILEHRIEVLNVAGNRDKVGTFHHDATVVIISWVLVDLESKGLLITRALQ